MVDPAEKEKLANAVVVAQQQVGKSKDPERPKVRVCVHSLLLSRRFLIPFFVSVRGRVEEAHSRVQ
jgi:hypothetical protein